MTTALTIRTAISSIRKAGARLRSWRRHEGSLRAAPVTTIYQVTDLLHREHTVRGARRCDRRDRVDVVDRARRAQPAGDGSWPSGASR